MINIRDLKVIRPDSLSVLEARAVQVFIEELTLRAGITPAIKSRIEPSDKNYVIICNEDSFNKTFPELKGKVENLEKPGAEGFRIYVEKSRGGAGIYVVGSDDRGAFFGMGRLLRKLYLKNGLIGIDEDFKSISTTPEYALRGHQLAYRNKQNTCDAWTEKEFDRYIRDLALFGSNSIEILPPRTDDTLFSPLFKVDPLVMMVKLSEIIHSYGLDVWLWYPNMGKDYTKPEVIKAELDERQMIFSAIPYLDAVLVPGGDPGELEPVELFKITEDSVKVLKKYHPDATVWISPQVFGPTQEWLDAFYAEMAKEPRWLDGISFAPWEKHTIEEMASLLTPKYRNKIRHYPDITHNMDCQFALPDWDSALAFTIGREGFNTRPKAMKYIHNKHAGYTIGSLTYSEGIHDDVNKFVWGDQDWDSAMTVEETIRDYVRLFIDPDRVNELTELFIATEDNWVGPLAQNENVDRLYRRWTELESSAEESLRENFRFQMGLARAITDYYVKKKLLFETELEKRAFEVLKNAPGVGADKTIRDARNILNLYRDEPVELELKHKLLRLSDSLFKKCGIQLSSTHQRGQMWIRGAYLDTIDMPLNDSQWLTVNFRRILNLKSEKEKLFEIDKLVNRTNPGEGGFYNNLGTYEGFEHVIRDYTWEQDPGYLKTPIMDTDLYGIMMYFHAMRGWHNEFPMPLAWARRARTLYNTPLKVVYDKLDPTAQYKIRITYPMAMRDIKVNLRTGDGTLIHDLVPACKSDPYYPVYEYDLPSTAYKDGKLELTWQAHDILRGVAISEIWIIRKN